jgi:hypothetical protein
MKHVLKFTPEILLVGYVLLFLFFKNPGVEWDRSINSDGKGYYAYLPAIFIYHDLSYKFVESYEAKYYPPDRSVFKEFRIQKNGKTINKCFPGLAILWLPFFLIAHLLSFFFGQPTDGYSLFYQYAISIAALFYFWLGCRFIMRILHKAGGSVRTAAFVTSIIAFGTNIIYYAVVENSMSHIFSFSLIAGFIYYSFRYFQDKKGLHFIFCSVIYGLIVLVRPPNGLVILLLPLSAWLANPVKISLSSVFNSYNLKTHYLVTGSILLLLLFSLPLFLWHHTTGHWLVYQYGEERFHFLHPHFLGILFSYNRGWFLYTPIAFISVFGLIYLWMKNTTVFYATLSFLIIFIYISSCWWMWYYASKFGQRIFIDFYALVAILLFLLFKLLDQKKILQYSMNFILVLFTILNLFQCYQHAKFIFPATDITGEIYWDSFTRLTPVAKVYLPDDAIVSRKSFFTDMEKPQDWENPWSIRSHFGTSGKHCSMIIHQHPYSVGRVEVLDPLFKTANRIINVSAMVYTTGICPGASIVVEVKSGDQKLSHNSFYLSKFVHPYEWTKVEAAFYVLRNIPLNSYTKIYLFNNSLSVPLFVDDLKIDYFSLKDEVDFTMMEGIQMPVK